MNTRFQLVRIGDVAKPVDRSETPTPGKTYRQAGVRLWGEGAYERESIDGSETRYSALSRLEAGDIVVNKIWARNGSVSVIPSDLSGCYVSSEFPTFVPDPDSLDSRWFHWLTKTPYMWSQCDEKSRGTSGKNRIRPERFLEIEIPLPPLDEQRRIVAGIEELAAKIEEARALRVEARSCCDALMRAMLFSLESSSLIRMAELVNLRSPDVVVQGDETYHFAGVYSFGRGVFVGQRKSGTEISYQRLTRLRAGDFVYPKLMAWEGALGVVPPECDNLVVSTEFPVFEVDHDRVLPDVLDVYFRTPEVWPRLAGTSTGTNVRRRRLHPRDFLSFEIAIPPMPRQRQLRIVKAKVDTIKVRHDQALRDLDALQRSILERAFEGKLW